MMGFKGFTVESWKHKFLPKEDAYRYSQHDKLSIISVADAITRDSTNGELPDLKTLSGQLKFVVGYQRPSPSSYVANMFCECFNFSLGLMYSNSETIDQDSIFSGFRIGNQAAGNFNIKFFPNPDYLKKDLAGCVASGAVVNGRDVFYGYIADCGFVVFDDNGDIRFKTENEGPNSKGSIDEDVAKKYGTGFNFPEGRKIIRSLYRNNPSEPLSYGAITGEIRAMDYVRTGYFELGDKDIAMVFTDGLENVIQSGEFAEKIRAGDFRGIKKLCRRKVRTEGSLVFGI